MLVYALPNGGPTAMIWGVSLCRSRLMCLIIQLRIILVVCQLLFSRIRRIGHVRTRFRDAHFRWSLLLDVQVLATSVGCFTISYFTFTMLIKKTGTVSFCHGLSDVRLDFILLIVL